MIINENIGHEVESIGEQNDSLGANIDTSSFTFLFEMMSKSLYSNPIGSICREITSNCFDSHIEANVSVPVIVKKSYDYDDSCYYISFIDRGVGLSPKRIKTIYMKWFSSTKRETNDLIGGFGLGSKSPLSYQDLFYINTIYNGVKYEYVLHKGTKVPTLDLLTQNPPNCLVPRIKEVKLIEIKRIDIAQFNPLTDEHNGTEIKIAIKNGDDRKFQEQLLEQLAYFDNVFFQDWAIDNVYKIYEGQTFKYRNKDQYSEDMHIILGKVPYPIDWKLIGVKEVNIPVAIKFEIGELEVTPSRESLRYTDSIKELVKTRVNDCIKELVSLFAKEVNEFEDIFEYLDNRNKRPHILFGDVDKLYIPKEYGVKSAYKYKPVAHLDITIPVDPFFAYRDNMELANEKVVDWRYSNGVSSTIKSSKYIYCNDLPTNKMKNIYMNSGYGYNRLVIVRENRQSFKEYCRLLGFSTATNGNRFAEKKDKYTKMETPQLGRAKAILEYKRAIHNEVLKKALYDYDNYVIDQEWLDNYNLVQKENSLAYQRKLNQKFPVRNIGWKESYDMSVADIEGRTGLIIYGYLDDDEELQQVEALLCGRFSLLDDKKTRESRRIYNERKDNTADWYIFKMNKQACQVLRIAKGNTKYFSNNQNCCYVKDFKSDNPLFRDLATGILLSGLPFINNWDSINLPNLAMINQDIADRLRKIDMFVKNNTYSYIKGRISNASYYNAQQWYGQYQPIVNSEGLVTDLQDMRTVVTYATNTPYFVTYQNLQTGNEMGFELNPENFKLQQIFWEILDIARTNNWFNQDILNDVKFVEKWYEGIEFLKHCKITEHSIPILVKELVKRGKKVNGKFFTHASTLQPKVVLPVYPILKWEEIEVEEVNHFKGIGLPLASSYLALAESDFNEDFYLTQKTA